MIAPLVVTIHGAWLRALPFLPALALEGALIQGPDGSSWRVRLDGRLDPIIAGSRPWNRSIASDPAPMREP